MKPSYRDGWTTSDTTGNPTCMSISPNDGAKMDEVTERKCDTCVIAQTHNLEDDDSPCRDCGEGEDGDKS